MTLWQIWKELGERVHAGNRDEAALVAYGVEEIEKDEDTRDAAIEQFVMKRVRDLIAAAVKPTGKTSRVPAGQGDFGWFALEPTFALDRLRRQIRNAYAALGRAQRHAQVLGIIDAASLVPTDYKTFGALCEAANVPSDLMAAFAAEDAA